MEQKQVDEVDFEQIRCLIRQMNKVTKSQVELAKKQPPKYFVRASEQYWVEYALVVFTLAGAIALGRAII